MENSFLCHIPNCLVIGAESSYNMVNGVVNGNVERLIMPEISRFFGIVIAIFYNEHNPPHFHARYGGEKASISIDDLRVMEGSLSPRALGLVMEWAAQHKPELMHCWEQARDNQQPDKIDPLA